MRNARQQKLFGAAVLKMSFAMQGGLYSPTFLTAFPLVLSELDVSEGEVDAFTQTNLKAVRAAATGKKQRS